MLFLFHDMIFCYLIFVFFPQLCWNIIEKKRLVLYIHFALNLHFVWMISIFLTSFPKKVYLNCFQVIIKIKTIYNATKKVKNASGNLFVFRRGFTLFCQYDRFFMENFLYSFPKFFLSRNSFVVQFRINVSFRFIYQARKKVSVLIMNVFRFLSLFC